MGFTVKAGVRVVSKAVLKETSRVVFPANALADVTVVKHGDAERNAEECQFSDVRRYL
jgi:hypothetical protein